MAPTDDLLSSAQVAAMLGVDRATVKRWAVAGKLTVAQTTPLGRLFRRADVEALRLRDTA